MMLLSSQLKQLIFKIRAILYKYFFKNLHKDLLGSTKLAFIISLKIILVNRKSNTIRKKILENQTKNTFAPGTSTQDPYFTPWCSQSKINILINYH